jgi:general secretion pathway protein G
MKPTKGFTIIELVIVLAIMSVLASAALPMLKMSVQRVKEQQLNEDLRQIRQALDSYKKAYDDGKLGIKTVGKSGYPPNLDVLVDGVSDQSDPSNKTVLKFLRRIPIDPMLSRQQIKDAHEDLTAMWGIRSYESDSNNPKPGDDVYDVYSLSPQTGSNGVPYAQW